MMKSDQHPRALDQLEPLQNSLERRGKRLASKCLIALLTAWVVLPIAASNRADAQTVTITFTGEVSTVVGMPFGIASNVGDPVSVSVTYDLTVADTVASSNVGRYPQNLLSGFSYTIGSNVIETSCYSILVVDDSLDQFTVGANDEFVVNDILVIPAAGDAQTRMDMSLFNSNGDSFSNDGLPIAFDITKLTGQTFNFGQSAQSSGLSENQFLRFTVDSAVFTLDANEPPTADAGSNQSIRVGDT